ncbi:MAG TPA: DUF3515 family protein [Micromonosporaceae bacterium]|jgi:hypothetical protein
MASDPVRRKAARTATIVAVPIALAVLAVSALAFGGFGSKAPPPEATGPVAMTTRGLTDDTVQLCQLVIANLPDSVAGHARRPVTAGSEQNAAYGDPPITVECGTPPPTVGTTDEVFKFVSVGDDGKLYGVCWYPAAGDGRTVWTSVDRTVPVTVTVPGSPDGSGQLVAPFSVAVGENIPLRDAGAIPTGCSQTPPTS